MSHSPVKGGFSLSFGGMLNPQHLKKPALIKVWEINQQWNQQEKSREKSEDKFYVIEFSGINNILNNVMKLIFLKLLRQWCNYRMLPIKNDCTRRKADVKFKKEWIKFYPHVELAQSSLF